MRDWGCLLLVHHSRECMLAMCPFLQTSRRIVPSATRASGFSMRILYRDTVRRQDIKGELG